MTINSMTVAQKSDYTDSVYVFESKKELVYKIHLFGNQISLVVLYVSKN